MLEFLREQDCLACGVGGPSDIHHVKSRGAGGGDDAFNIIPLCRVCHERWHKMGGGTFVKKKPHVGEYLKSMGWELWPKLYHPANR